MIAVVIPTLDDSPALRRSLLSISRQTVRPDEVIVVANGHRAGGVASSVERWSELQPMPLVVDIGDPPGVARALNAGIKAARARYVIRLDAGDWSYPDRIALQVRALDEEGLDLVAGDYDAVTPEGARLPKLRGRLPTDGTGLTWHLLVQNCIAHPTVALRRESVLRAGLYDEDALFEDYDLWLRMIGQWRMRLLDVPVVEYCYSRGSRTREVKMEATSQLVDRYIHAWSQIAGITISAGAAKRLLAPDLRPMPGSESLQSSLDALAALTEIERLASLRLSPTSYLGLRQRVAVSRIELLATTARAHPAGVARLVSHVPASAIAPVAAASMKLARLVLTRRSAEIRQRGTALVRTPTMP